VVRTALNARVSWWRRWHREVIVPVAAADIASDGYLDSVLDRHLMAKVLRLPERQRQVVALRLFLDLDTAQTADVLGIAPGTVTAHLARAIATLRQELSNGTGLEEKI
jgi:RNA polymerase sigma factor (sigma-70 family)